MDFTEYKMMDEMMDGMQFFLLTELSTPSKEGHTNCVPINDIENITVLILNFYMAYLILQS